MWSTCAGYETTSSSTSPGGSPGGSRSTHSSSPTAVQTSSTAPAAPPTLTTPHLNPVALIDARIKVSSMELQIHYVHVLTVYMNMYIWLCTRYTCSHSRVFRCLCVQSWHFYWIDTLYIYIWIHNYNSLNLAWRVCMYIYLSLSSSISCVASRST